MIIVNVNDLKNILKNATTLCEKKNIVSVFDLIFIIQNNQIVVITEGTTGAGANILNIENSQNLFCIIKTSFNILNKIIANISTEFLILYPQEQGILIIQSYNKEENSKKKNINMNFSIYSHNLYLNNQQYDEENFNKYKIYWNFLINNQWDNSQDIVIELDKTKKFIEFLKTINYAASSDNDRAFSNIFFQWEKNEIIANSSNRIRVAVGKFPTLNSTDNIVKFSCDKKSINSFIKSVQNYLEEPLNLRINNNGRIYCLIGQNFLLEIGYSVKRSINITEFFSVLENSQSFLCNTEEIKQAIQCAKSFATKFHYSILIENKQQELSVDNNKNQLRFFFQEPNHGNIETYINDESNNIFNFHSEVNVLYLWDAVSAVHTKKCLLMINDKLNYLFIIPYTENINLNNIKNTYQDAHLIMCLR
jgi:hypothetical protein